MLIDNQISLMSSVLEVDSNPYDVFSVFSTQIWVLIIVFLTLTSILGIKYSSKDIFLLQFLNSTFDHLECLIRNCCKLVYFNSYYIK